MNNTTQIREEDLQAVAFVGEALAPFFLNDPKLGSAGASYDAFAKLSPGYAAKDWPFGEESLVESGLSKMVFGLDDGITESIIWEYRRLFVGPGTKAAPPWGSVYTDRDGVIFGKSALDLHDWMRVNGIERIVEEGDPDDHIGLLLSMMSWIAMHRPELLFEFLRLHVLTWSSHYLEQLEQRAEHEFFEGLAILTRASLEGIREYFEIEVDYPRFYR